MAKIKLIANTESYSIYNGSMLDMLEIIEPNTIDSIITDPPYELNFMNKGWDRTGIAFQPETWRKCYEVLKPGGYLLAFGGSKTFHRIACAIEDAGFEIRDTIMWLYGCLSEDTEILTLNGWERYHKAIEESPVICYNMDKDSFEIHQPERSFIYENKHPAYRIKSDFTDQIVSRNHRCIVERGGRKVFAYAETLERQESVPFLESLHDLPETIPYPHEGTSITKQDLLQRVRLQEYQQKQEGESNPSGAMRGEGVDNLPCMWGYGKTRTTLATVEEVEYVGNMWCVQVPTGAFVARRNGQIFITGNSGFPKSLNIGLAIDKKLGLKSKIIGKGKSGNANTHTRSLNMVKNPFGGEYEIKQAQNQWQGWGTALKPAYEPIIVARKPFKGTVADNVIKYGVGGINIDGCRIPLENGETIATNVGFLDNLQSDGWGTKKCITEKTSQGRFPANVIHDGSDEVESLFPHTKSGKMTSEHQRHTDGSPNGIYGKFNKEHPLSETYGDSGSASRFFYCAKANKKDRDEGLEIAASTINDGRKKSIDNPYQRGETLRKNIHPTVKPCELMQYLVRLVTPKGGIILDPFMGSGSTGKACMFENRERQADYKFIGIDLEEEYCNIARDRIDYALNKYKYDYQQELEKAKEKGQLSLF